MRTKLIIVVVASILLNACNTIGTQQFTYLGNDSSIPNVVGVVEHKDFMGIGISADQYAKEYESALEDAFDAAPHGTVSINEIKVFKEYRFANQIWGAIMTSTGALIISSAGDEGAIIGGALSLVGFILTGTNRYNFILIGEPSESL